MALSAGRVVIIGAGMGGIAAALRLSAAGHEVMVLDSADGPGGKMRTVRSGEADINAGPTVFTMKWAFERLLEPTGRSLESLVDIKPMSVLARHAWSSGARLDLFADVDRSRDGIAEFAGTRDADGFMGFVRESRAIFETLKDSYIAASRPGPFDLVSRIGLHRLADMMALKPFSTLWSAMSQHFADPRLRQLFGRYATYCGSSPFSAPATLMLVAHVEQAGVWMVDGGMAGLARTLAAFAQTKGATFRYGKRVTGLQTSGDRVTGVMIDEGETIAADHVIYNGDVSALSGLVDPSGRAPGAARVAASDRSLSAVTFCLDAPVQNFGLAHHTVFFSDDYRSEFAEIFKDRQVPREPTTYICAQDRRDDGTLTTTSGRERLLCLVNAPADGDTRHHDEQEIARCRNAMMLVLDRCGMRLDPGSAPMATATPTDFAKLFPGSGGALYGRASHGWLASFQREGARTALANLYLAGGTVHPGPGVPMAALSGILAAETLAQDRALMPKFRPVATSGGMLTG